MTLRSPRYRLFWKYVIYFVALVSSVLLASGTVGWYFSYDETRAAVVALQREKALGAAFRIEQFITEIEHQIAWTDQPRIDGNGTYGRGTFERRHLGFIRLLHQAPAITDVSWLDDAGREQLRVSRLALDRLRSGSDMSATPAFRAAQLQRVYFSPVYFRQETEPYLTVAFASEHRGGGVTVAEVNLKFVWDAIARIHVGKTGHAYVVDGHGQLISHPNISLVLQRTELSHLRQVSAALAPASHNLDDELLGLDGQPVLAAHARVEPVGWVVLVEQSVSEAFAPLYSSLVRMAWLWLLGLALSIAASLVLARRMVTPIRALQAGAAHLEAGKLDEPIRVNTGDELESLADEFNRMAARLRESYADLERKVAERTCELAAANQAKSRFLAAASHDLRQPMHALGLFVAQLRNRVTDPATQRIAAQADVAVEALQELFDAILDVSRLDAGAVTPQMTALDLGGLFARIAVGFAPAASDKGLHLRVVPTRLAVRADGVLLERILINLVSNALRYTERGGIVVGCRRRGEHVRIEVWDSGIGIAPAQQEAVFQEFYQAGNPERDRHRGLGLGLAIAARLACLLGSRIELSSRPGTGSMFAFELPRAVVPTLQSANSAAPPVPECLRGALIVVIDDDTLVQEAMGALLAHWGCEVVLAASGDDVLITLARLARTPDAIVCDYRLADRATGIEAIQRIRSACQRQIPATLVSGDTAPERLREARQSGFTLLHKPVRPAKLRAVLEHLLGERSAASMGAGTADEAGGGGR